MSEEQALEKAKISSRVYDGWFRQSLWTENYNKNIRICARRANLLISAFKETAAIQLITLTESKKEVTARQACLDILSMETEQKEQDEKTEKRDMKPETQKAILKIMAEDREN